MTPNQAEKYVPNPHTEGYFYPTPHGWQVALTCGRGKHARKHYVTARRKRWLDIVDHHGNPIDQFQTWQLFRACLSDEEPHWQPLSDGRAASYWRLAALPDVEAHYL